MELRERLRLALQPTAGPHPVASRLPPRRPVGLPLRRVETSRGAVYLAEEWWPLDHHHGHLPLGDALALDATAIARLAPACPARLSSRQAGRPGLDTCDLADAAFIDVETTGLAGGTGTYVFLVGIGTFELARPAGGPARPARLSGRQAGGDGSFRLRQFFLADLPGEAAMLAAVAEVLAGCRALVSFNGRRFDLPLLETRLTLSRLPPVAPGLPHLDLLYPARRLYRGRLPSCRLASLEEALLGMEREDDVPGWAIPPLYFDYVRRGQTGPLRAVFRHNALDILSLAGLLAYLGRLTGQRQPTDANDCLAVARWDESEGRLADAARLYAAALEGGVEGDARALALRRLARLYRRLGRWQDAARLWSEEAGDHRAPDRKLEALIELAKLEEHRRRDYAAAEALTRRALSLLELMDLRGQEPTAPALRREALEHRLWRLRRRQSASSRGVESGSGAWSTRGQSLRKAVE